MIADVCQVSVPLIYQADAVYIISHILQNVGNVRKWEKITPIKAVKMYNYMMKSFLKFPSQKNGWDNSYRYS